MRVAHHGGFRQRDRLGDRRQQVLGLRRTIADSTPAQQNAGAIDLELPHDLHGDQVGDRLRDTKLRLRENGRVAARILERQSARGVDVR